MKKSTTNSTWFLTLFWLYQVIRSLRYWLLMTVFGTVSHCHQQPTCGSFFISLCKSNGFLYAVVKTIPRVLTCSTIRPAKIA